MELKHESITLSSLVRRALNATCSILICFSRQGGGVFAPGFLQQTQGAIYSTKISGNFGPKLNGSVRSNRKSFEKNGPPIEVDKFSRSESWLNGSRPHVLFTAASRASERSLTPPQLRSAPRRRIAQNAIVFCDMYLQCTVSQCAA